MSSDYFYVSPPELRGAAASYESASQSLQQVFQSLQAALSSAGEFWGGDEAGQTFAESYLPGAENARAGFQNAAEDLRELGAGVEVMADNYEQADESGEQMIGRCLPPGSMGV